MADISNIELNARQQGYGQALEGRQAFLKTIKGSDTADMARNPNIARGQAERRFTGQALEANYGIQAQLQSVMGRLGGLSGGLEEKQVGAVAGAGTRRVTQARNQATQEFETVQTGAEARFAGMLARLGQLDLQLTGMRRDYAQRTFGTGANTDINSGNSGFQKYYEYITGIKSDPVLGETDEYTGILSEVMPDIAANEYGDGENVDTGTVAALQEEFGV